VYEKNFNIIKAPNTFNKTALFSKLLCIINGTTEKVYKWRYDTQHNVTQVNDIWHNDTRALYRHSA
jgi:hypothetical protein